MGLIWLDHPVVWHSSRIPSGYDYSMMTLEERALMESKWHNWYSADWDYGQTTLAFFCTGIAIVSLFKIVLRLRGRRPSASRPPTVLDRLVAACRYSTSRQFHVQRFHWYSPPLGVVVALGGIFMFLMALMLSARPYDWSNHAMGHSPPLATRAGWMSIAIMPFMIVFATKVNFIGFLTGVSHEKLQVYHRWSAFFMYITSLVHTFPFIIKSIDLGEMELVWATSSFYWTGVAALVPQTYLVLLSWGFFRNRYYEIFKKLHYVAASIFMAALFIHVDFILTSWDYFWAVVGLYGVSWLTRILRTHYNSGVGIPATVQTLPGDIIKVSIQAPKRLRWSPGQHVFVRFVNLGVDFFSSHPFTVASIPQGDGHAIDLVLKVKKGITRKLAKVADGKAAHATNVLVDGPYGGLPFSLKDFDTVFLLAGGSGASFTLPLLLDLVQGFESGMACTRIEFIVAVKTVESNLWMKGDLDNARRMAGDKLHIRICVTGEPANKDNDSASIVNEEKTEPHLGRPDLPRIIEEACRGATGRIAFAACGPESLLYDVRNAVAECQLAIADGFGSARDIYLHTENFGW